MGENDVINCIQRDLEDLYKIDTGLAIADFRIENEGYTKLIDDIPPNQGDRILVEQIDDQNISVGVCISNDNLDALCRKNPQERLDNENLASFLIVLEEISHFTLLIWSAQHIRQVSQLGLEMQAELDKFLLSAFYLHRQDELNGATLENLLQAIFKRFTILIGIAETDQLRYLKSNAIAYRYARYLANTYLRKIGWVLLLEELRSFYRFSNASKISYIHRLSCGHL